MPERIYKLQPDRTLYLRGFDSFASAASLHSASPNGFTASGTFRDPADFCVAVLYDADNFYEHPSIKYLPDFDFSGLTLSFDLLYSDAVQPIDSPKFNWIDWATLDCILANGGKNQFRLWDNAMLQSPTFPAATGSITVQTTADGIQPFDQLTLWFQNFAFDYAVPAGHRSVEIKFFAKSTGSVHSISVNGRNYSHTETDPEGELSATIANALIGAINADGGDPDVSASVGSVAYSVVLTLNPTVMARSVSISASDDFGSASLYQTTPELVASTLTTAINTTDWASASATQLAPTQCVMASNTGATINLTAARYGKVNVAGTAVTYSSGARFSGITAGSTILLAGTPYLVASTNSPTSITLTAQGPTGTDITYVAPRGGRDGNEITVFARGKTGTLTTDRAANQSRIQLTGGRSDVTWRCTFDFSSVNATVPGADQIRQCWLTFAPSLANGAAYTGREWTAQFSNWQLAGDETKRSLKVAGPGSVRIEETDSACVFTGTWTSESGFYSKYFASATRAIDNSVVITYNCQFEHSLYVGTSLYVDRATAGVQLDGDTETELACYLATDSAVVTRRLVRTKVAAGKHTVKIRQKTTGVFYFDFLEAAALSDVPAPIPDNPYLSPALDFDTDHTYKLPPARVHWIVDQLGFTGPMNEYLGVFWWNERKLVGGTYSVAKVQFTGTWASGDTVLLTLSGTPLGKTILGVDDSSTIASHFAAYINQTFGGAWAEATDNLLTIHGRSPALAYQLTTELKTQSALGQAQITQTPVPGTYGTWYVDDTAANPINRATRDWHADFYALGLARGREVTTACSMELVLPPAGYAARYPDTAKTAVATDTGFGSLSSNHCAIGGSKMLAYQSSVYQALGNLQQAAGLTPSLQFGEFLWWFFSGPGGMAFYDDETTAAAQAVLGRPLHVFVDPNDDPGVNGGADAIFLRNRLRDHVATLVAQLRSAFPAGKLELLWPDDVNHNIPVPTTTPYLGGRLNRFINLPTEWQKKPSSGLDRIKVEALAFGSAMRDLDLAREAIEMFPNFGWPLDSVRYMAPVFGIATPWMKEVGLARGASLNAVNLWAFDHICLFNMDLPEKQSDRRSFVLTS